jgi:hypothetical protein
MPSHTVVQGEFLAKIARNYGFTDYLPIWTYGPNSDLRKERTSPNVLLPGDQLEIPEKNVSTTSGATEQLHRFRLKGQPLSLCIVLLDMSDNPIADESCTLVVDAEEFELTTDGDGSIKQEIPTDTKQAELRILDMVIPLLVGHLDPVCVPSGQEARLENLGYAVTSDDESDEQAFQGAVEEFQCDKGLVVDGICGPKTQAKLEDVHGS